MLHNRIPASSLPVNLPDSARIRLSRIIGADDILGCPWITLSLVHSSYLNEHLSDFEMVGISVDTLHLLESLGTAFTELALHNLAYVDPQVQTTGEADNFVSGVVGVVYQRIAENLCLAELAFASVGASHDVENMRGFRQTFLSTLGSQFLGALAICSNYEILFSLVETTVEELHVPSKPIMSYKSALLEYSQARKMGLPEYKLVEETGPNHARLFYSRAYTRDGRWAEGKGSSKKQAEEVAARSYMEEFAPNCLAGKVARVRRAGLQLEPHHVPPELHRAAIQALCKDLQIPSDKMWLLSQALVHRSFLNETQSKSCQDNRMLAQLGAGVFDAIATKIVVDKLIESALAGNEELSPGHILAPFRETSVVSEGFDLLKLEKALLVGKGQAKQGITSTIKADTLQAVLAAIFLANGTFRDSELSLPSSLVRWLSGSIEKLIVDPDTIIHPKDKLQRQLQLIRMPWEYRIESQGPEYDKEYRASVVLLSPLIKRRFIIREGRGATRREAESKAALLVSRIIDEVNSGIGVTQASGLLKDKAGRSFALFLLEHELSCIPTSQSNVVRWQKEGMLGSQLLMEKGLSAFRLWARAADSFLKEDESGMPKLDNVSRFYKLLRATSSQRVQYSYQDQINTISRFLDQFDLERQQPDVRERREFSEILALSKISSLLSRKRTTVKLADVLEDLLLLRRDRRPLVRLQRPVPSLSISERAGACQLMLNEVLSLLNKEDFSDDSFIVLSISDDPKKMMIDFEFKLPSSLRSAEETKRMIDRSSLWSFLIDEIPISYIGVFSQEIHIHSEAYHAPFSNRFATVALEAYGQESAFSRSENEVISRLLHDLKNELIACQVSLESAGVDRTGKLKSKYEASKHLDKAMFLCHSLETIGRAVGTPTIMPINPREFFRQYVAEKIVSIPSNIRVDPPTTIESCEVWTSPDFLRSTIDNLVRNSVEAMPDGGEIRLDWLFDPTYSSLFIEISDTGPGIDDILLKRLLAGRRIESTKEGGSGIGMLTVNAMLQRIGGTISAETDPSRGTRWTIVLPSLQELDESVIPAQPEEDMETLTYSAKRGDLQ